MNIKNFSITILAIAVGGLFTITQAEAKTYDVSNVDGLIAAINEANSNNEADTINISNGTYYFNQVSETDKGPNALPVIQNDTTGLDLTLNGSTNVIFERQDEYMRFIKTATESEVIIKNIAFNYGLLNEDGGAIYIENKSTARIESCFFHFNESLQEYGGAIRLNTSSDSYIIDSYFDNNTSAKDGGAIYSVLSNITLQSSDFDSNASGTDRSGGAVHIDGANRLKTPRVEILDTSFSYNKAYWLGGGVSLYLYDGENALISDSSFYWNTAYDQTDGTQGGGGAINIGSEGATMVIVRRTNFLNNSAESYGGAVIASGDKVLIENSSINFNNAGFMNSVRGYGGGLYIQTDGLTVNNSTIAYNTSNFGGAGFNTQDKLQAQINNSIISNNQSSTTGYHNCNKAVSSTDPNIVFVPDSFPNNLSIQCTDTDINANPLLIVPSEITEGIALELDPTSPAIDVGGDLCSSEDQDGLARDLNCDLGAFEYRSDFVTEEETWKVVTNANAIIVGDFNGDGYSDLLERRKADEISNFANWYVYEGNGHSIGNSTLWISNFGHYNYDDFYVMDINNDGMDDLIVATNRVDVFPDIIDELSWYAMISDGTKFIDGGRLQAGYGIKDLDKFYIADINQDGKDDMVVSTPRVDFNKNVDGDLAWYLMAVSEGGFVDMGRINDSFGLEEDRYFIGDFDGDSKDDMYVFTTRTVDPLPVNLGSITNYSFYLMKSDGQKFVDAGKVGDIQGSSHDRIIIADYDDDNDDDILWPIAVQEVKDSPLAWVVSRNEGLNVTWPSFVLSESFGSYGNVAFSELISIDNSSTKAIIIGLFNYAEDFIKVLRI